MKTKIKYFNPNEIKKNSRRGINIGGNIFFNKKDIRLAMCECNLYFYKINKNEKSKNY